MGWLWPFSSPTTSPSSPSAPSPPQSPSSTPNSSAPPSSPPSDPLSAPLPDPSRPKTRDEAANSELLEFLRSLQAPTPSDPQEQRRLQEQADDLALDEDEDEEPSSATPSNPPTLLTPTHLYPSTTSCRALFDQAFYCQSPGGQFLNVYRYGRMKNCAQHWSNFWWCVRTNRNPALSAAEREERVRRRYWEQDQRFRKNPEGCSEDVWRQRKYRITEGVFVDGIVPPYPGEEGGEKSKTM